jgi:uncharacterized protein
MTSMIPAFTDTHAALLRDFLSSPRRPKGTMTYPQTAGFLFSMASGPELIPPSEWLPIIFHDQEGVFETPGEAERILGALMALYNACGAHGMERREPLPPGCEIRTPPLANLEADALLSQWAMGFAMGHGYLCELWEECAPKELDEELGGIVALLTFFASPRIADAYLHEARRPMTLEQYAETVVKFFPDAAVEYVRLGRAIYQARLGLDESESGPSDRPAVGRNDPCPCGSGKKFKTCCGATTG